MDPRQAAGQHGRQRTGGRQGRTPAPASATAGMPAEHALLGLIALSGGEAHGYELARHFDSAHPLGLGEILRLEQSMLYQHLKKLEKREWVTGSLQPQGARPPRQMYQLTGEGRAELRRWLAEPVARTREIRLEFLVKLFFALQFDRARARRLITEQQEVCQGIAAALEEQTAALGDPAAANDDRETRFRHMVFDLRLEQTRAAATWLDNLAAWARSSGAEAES